MKLIKSTHKITYKKAVTQHRKVQTAEGWKRDRIKDLKKKIKQRMKTGP